MIRMYLMIIGLYAFATLLLRDVLPPPPPMVAPPVVVTDTLSDSEIRDQLVVRYALDLGVDTSLALDVTHAENWTGNSKAVSSAGAIGLMQVMPRYWEGKFPECGKDLFDRETNVCYGVNILRHYLLLCRYNTYCALNRYNGARDASAILSYHSEIGRARERRTGLGF